MFLIQKLLMKGTWVTMYETEDGADGAKYLATMQENTKLADTVRMIYRSR